MSRFGYRAWQATGPSARQAADAALRDDIRARHTIHRQRYEAPRSRAGLARRGQQGQQRMEGRA